MKNIILKNAILLVLVFITFGQQSAVLSQTSQQAEIPTVAFCDLLRDKEQYKDKTVRIRAVYSFFFETSRIFCLECVELKDGLTWLDFEKQCKGSKKIKGNEFDGRTVMLQVVGKFETGDGYGHFGVYPNRFVVSCVEKVKTLAKTATNPQELPANVREKANCCNDVF